MKPTKCPAKGKKWEKKGKRRKKHESRKAKEEGRKESEKKKPRLLSVSLLDPRTILEANILHLDQKTAKCTTYKQLCGTF